MPLHYFKSLFIAALFLLCAAPAQAADLPADVAAFIQKRDICDHFRGEEPYDAARAAFINRQLDTSCKGTDKALSMLRKKYAANKNVLNALHDYEDTIEAPE